jgi:8-oxo-dGTP pyrophosphatase MutT (NUDIX family)
VEEPASDHSASDLIPTGWGANRAVAAIIVVRDLGYLLQLRDDRKGIWYPGYWGLFGGTAERGETGEAAIRRELAEELALVGATLRYVMSMSLGFAWADGQIQRDFFEVRLTQAGLAALRLGEGRGMRCWPDRDIPGLRLVPADRLALDFHAQHDAADQAPAGA